MSERRPARSTAPPEILACAAALVLLGLWIVGARSALALGWIGQSEWTDPVLAVGIGFLLSATVLLAQHWQYRRLARAATVALLFLTLVRLTHHAFGWSLIDPHPALVAAFAFIHGWMVPRSAEMLFVACIGFVAYDPPWRSRLRAPVVAALGSLLAIVCVLQLGIGLGSPGTRFGWEYFTVLSPQTVLGFLTLGVAMFGRAWRDELQQRPAGPVWIPIPIALVLIVATFVLWRGLRVEEWLHLQALTERELVTLKEMLIADIRQEMNTMVGFARRWETGAYDRRTTWDADTSLQLEQNHTLHAIAWADSEFTIRWITSNAPADKVVGFNLLSERHRRLTAHAAQATRRPVISKPVRLQHDGTQGFLILCPIYRGDRFDGLIVGVFRYRELFDPLLYGRAYAVEIRDGPITLYGTGGPPGRVAQSRAVSLDGTTWMVDAWPTPALYAQEQSSLPGIVLGAGLLMALLVALIVRFSQTAVQRADEARRAQTIADAHAETLATQSAQLAAARDAALSATSAKSAFLATMSHEIRTPMNGVVGTVSLLSDTRLSNEQREYVDQIRLSADNLLRLIDDILDFSKAESGRLTLETIDLDLRTLVEEAADLMAASAQRKGIELAVLVEPDVPTAVRGDGVRLRQVLLNFLSNAIKFTSRGLVTLTVSRHDAGTRAAGAGDATAAGAPASGASGATAASAANAEAAASVVAGVPNLAGTVPTNRVLLRFTVTDTGIGISAAALGRLFESFSQADSSTTRRYGGSGLGLAIARQLAELMGGSVGAISEEGRGSTFWFTARLDESVTPARGAIEPDALAGVRVLVTDDEPIGLAGLREQLRQLGALVDTAMTAPAAHDCVALAAREGRPYRVIFVDESVAFAAATPAAAAAPALDVRELPPETIAVLTTAHSRSSATERAAQVGYHGCVTKPARRRHLEGLVLSATGRDAGHAAVALAPMHPSSDGNGSRALRVLVAEDNEINQKVIARMLQKLGHQVEVVVNGREAVDACTRGIYDLVLMDCQMPELDGYDATAAIRQQPGPIRRIPIVALTADASNADRDRCLAAGMDDFLGKPVRQPELARAIERWTMIRAIDGRQPA